jgi:hypothetical protein
MTFALQVNDALRKFSLDTVLGGLSTQKQTITVGSTINEELNDSGRHDVSFLGCVACICPDHLQKICKQKNVSIVPICHTWRYVAADLGRLWHTNTVIADILGTSG